MAPAGAQKGRDRLTADRWRRIESLCHAALARPAGERAAFLADACGDDGSLREEVESLIAGAESSPSFLETPVMDAVAPPSLVGRQIGVYRIEASIGTGGMGQVYRARDTRLNRVVAIKVLPPHLVNDPERRARFEREARAVSGLNHPNIVTLHEVGIGEAGPYLVLENIEGQSLREVLAAGPLSVRQLLVLAAQIADGLAKAHSAGIGHRDLKPDNIMVSADGFAKILDFGLAKFAWPQVAGAAGEPAAIAAGTASGAILGTLGYLSPEQAAGRPADERADQFAFGALLYEMATRERPFRRDTMAESLAATIRDEPSPLRSKRPDAPQQLAWIIERCLAKDPNDRYASSRDLARDLADVRDRLSDLRTSQAAIAEAASTRARRSRGFAWSLGVVGAMALVAAGYAVGRQMAAGDAPPTFRPLTFRRGIITGAKFSPDGQTVYYSAAFGAEPSRVFVTRLDSSASEPLKLPPAMLLSVSRRNELAVLLTNGRSAADAVGTLARVPTIGGSPRALVTDVAGADWAPDGERLAIQRANGSIEFPMGHRLGGEGLFPSVSPGGDRLAWITGEGVQIADTDGHIVVSEKVRAFGLAWAPHGREVWFTGSSAGGMEDRALFALSLAGKRRLIARAPGALTILDVAPDAHAALVSTGAGWFSLLVSRRGEAREQSLDLFGRTWISGLSADGTKLLAYEWSAVGPGMYLLSTNGTDPVKLGDDRPLGLSPDGEWALARRSSDRSRLFLVPTSAGSPRELPTPGLAPDMSVLAHWSPDGRRLFVALRSTADAGGRSRLYMRRDDETWQPVTPEGIAGPFAVSPDGGTIAAADAAGVVTLFPVDGRTPRRLDGERGTPILWSSDGRWLFLRGPGQVPARIYRHDLDSGRIESWRDLAPSDLSGVTAISDEVLLADDGNVCVYSPIRISGQLYYVQGVR